MAMELNTIDQKLIANQKPEVDDEIFHGMIGILIYCSWREPG